MEETEERMQIRWCNRDAIKYIAMVTMMLNHIAFAFLERGTLLHEIFEDVGYFTAPVMCFFLVEGYSYTRSKRKYGQRLLLFTVISQVPFYLALRLTMLNMFFTLLCAFLLLVVREKVMNPMWRRGLICGLVVVTIIGDWALFAAVLVLLLAEHWGDRQRMLGDYIVIALVFMGFNVRNYLWDGYGMAGALFHGALGCLGIVIAGFTVLFLYNGKRAEHGRHFSKWFFYIFYPAHLTVLYLVNVWLQGRG